MAFLQQVIDEIAAQDLVLSLSVRIPVSNVSATLAAILAALTPAAALPADTRRVVIAREDAYAAVALRYHVAAAASGTTEEVPGGVLDLATDKATADTLQLYAASGVYATVHAYVPRA